MPRILPLGWVAVCFVVFLYWMGLHIDSLGVYWVAGKVFVDGLDPYTYTAKYGPLSQFKYSPLFALGMAGLVKIEPTIVSIAIWALLGITACVVGMLRWMDSSKRFTLALGLALLAGYIDMCNCLWANQSNALVIGLSLIGLADYRDHRYSSAGLVLVLATVLKVYPIVFLGGLALRGERAYLRSAMLGAILAFSVPALFVGWKHNLATHIAWVQLLLHEVQSNGILDLRSALQRVGMLNLASRLPWVVALVSAPLLIAVRFLPINQLRPWIALTCASVVLLSPKTEVFNFVFLAPAYTLMVLHCSEAPQQSLRRYGVTFSVGLILLMIVSQFVIPNWMDSLAPLQVLRVLGALGFWLLSVTVMVQSLKPMLETCLANRSLTGGAN